MLTFTTMESSTDAVPQNMFTCHLCNLSTPFTYYGQKPPNTRAIVLLEECFVTKDPFSPDGERFLILGSNCSLCHITVCVGTGCSLFYSKRFCMQCVNKHLDQFPPHIQAELAKKKQPSKTDVS
ncbi:cysteine-rich DPF motif domain-containing protein 1 [Oncorhynchus nerka]|uniref:cysteine-rich DPF motif domain-containing protein 1 n=1 Tax=Oncorhynchus nerka TaxID=8023 RepID=UPI0011325348|nr:cysteine-rich DPF motif domain-containing protein 1 [Oncorhynchus nerka]XP_029485846.1 cysteine-rich DPF motif domain-containing protein 1 [Oncorhynchus nerka]